MNSQTIVVTSNVSDDRNHSNHFYNRLGTPLDLSQGQWQVAVKKMIYLNSFLNIINESITVIEKPVERTFRSSLESGKFVKDVPFYVTNDKKVVAAPYEINWEGGRQEYGWYINIQRDLEPEEVSYAVSYENGDGKIQVGLKFKPLTRKIKSRHNFTFWRGEGKDLKTVAVIFKVRERSTFVIPPGNYEHISELLQALNWLKIPGIAFTMNKGMVHAGIKDSVEELVLNNHLDLTLGFVSHKLQKSTTASHLPQLNRGRFAFFVYSNLVKPIHVGDMEVPLIDVISIPKREYGEIISLDVVNPLYSAVALKQVNEIEIMLATDSGEPITFDNRAGNAKTLLVLHFQRVV